jgi:hypothetical protein
MLWYGHFQYLSLPLYSILSQFHPPIRIFILPRIFSVLQVGVPKRFPHQISVSNPFLRHYDLSVMSSVLIHCHNFRLLIHFLLFQCRPSFLFLLQLYSLTAIQISQQSLCYIRKNFHLVRNPIFISKLWKNGTKLSYYVRKKKETLFI